MARRAVLLVVVMMCAGFVSWSSDAATRGVTQTLVFDTAARASFIDKPPAGPSVGDVELSTGRFRDSSGRFVGTTSSKCVFTKMIPGDVLERCADTARTSEGSVRLAGVGHLDSMNPPWQVTGLSGTYKRLHGTVVFQTDIALDPGVPVAPGRGFSVAVIQVRTSRRLHVGVVPRPAANASFIARANAACLATVARARRLPQFSFSNFDPFHPDRSTLPKVGRFFDQPARRRLQPALISKLVKLGAPPASAAAWRTVLRARRVMVANESAQVRAALADNPRAFVPTVYQQARDYNRLVFASAIFGVQSCTFS